MKYLWGPTTRFLQCLTSRMCRNILVVNIQFSKQCTKITCPVLYARGNSFLSYFLCIIALFTRQGWNLSDYVKRETRAEYYIHNSRWRLPIVSPLVRAPAACKCRNGRLTEEKPFHLVEPRAKQQWCVYTTRCACFCINALRIKSNMLQLYSKHIHTACHSQTGY